MTTAHSRPFAQVDVFTDRALLGNPLAVVLDGEGLDDETMLKFANWTNLSETTFAFPPTDPATADYKVRIFTTCSELPFAGHPTLGTCAALLASGRIHSSRDDGIIIQECGVGLVEVHFDAVDGLSFKAPRLLSPAIPVDVSLVLPLLPSLATDDVEVAKVTDAIRPLRMDIGIRWLIVPLPTLELLYHVRASAEVLLHITTSAACEGVTFFAPLTETTADCDIELRTFCIECGVAIEDPVCGSANACVARYIQDFGAPWVKRSGACGVGPASASTAVVARDEWRYTASQGSRLGRDGRIVISYREGKDGVVDPWVGGHVTQLISGVVTI